MNAGAGRLGWEGQLRDGTLEDSGGHGGTKEDGRDQEHI